MRPLSGLPLRNGLAVAAKDIPVLSPAAFRNAMIGGIGRGGRICAFFGVPTDRLKTSSGGSASRVRARLFAVLAFDESGWLSAFATDAGASFPSLTPECPQAHLFEREIFEQTGVKPAGHPWLKPVRSAPDPKSGAAAGPGAPWISTASAAERFTRSRSAPCTRASSSPVISVSSATASTCTTWRSAWGISTAAWKPRFLGNPDPPRSA